MRPARQGFLLFLCLVLYLLLSLNHFLDFSILIRSVNGITKAELSFWSGSRWSTVFAKKKSAFESTSFVITVDQHALVAFGRVKISLFLARG